MTTDPAHTDCLSDRTYLRERIRDLERDLAELRSIIHKRPRKRRSAEDFESDVEALWTIVAAYGPRAEVIVRNVFSKAVITECVRTGLLHRDPSARMLTLTAEQPLEASYGRIAAAIAEGPESYSNLRTMPGINRNTFSDLVERGIHEGHFRRGVIQNGKPGAPQRILARADQPLPIHWDTFKVEWK